MQDDISIEIAPEESTKPTATKAKADDDAEPKGEAVAELKAGEAMKVDAQVTGSADAAKQADGQSGKTPEVPQGHLEKCIASTTPGTTLHDMFTQMQDMLGIEFCVYMSFFLRASSLVH